MRNFSQETFNRTIYVIKSINITKVKIPIVVVANPIRFDLLHPASEMIVKREMFPRKKDKVPAYCGNLMSYCFIAIGKPAVVSINTFVMAKSVIK